jgi:hypothetical protein
MNNNRAKDIKYRAAIRQHNGSYIDKFGCTAWYNAAGEIHKEDGPALIYPDGRSYWFINGTVYSFKQWQRRSTLPDEQKLLLRLQYA